VVLHARVCECESLSANRLAPAGLEKLAAGYALVLCLDFSENYGSLDDYLQEYADGLMTAEAKAIYEALLEHGPLDTVRLRREARMSSESAKSRFDRGLVELQVGLKVLPIGVARTGAWNYAFTYELFQRWFPEVPEQARAIKRSEARRVLVQRYIDNVVAIDRKMIAKVFHVLKWTSQELDRTIATLLEERTIREIEIEGIAELAHRPVGSLAARATTSRCPVRSRVRNRFHERASSLARRGWPGTGAFAPKVSLLAFQARGGASASTTMLSCQLL
jgi:hypothetical protein